MAGDQTPTSRHAPCVPRLSVGRVTILVIPTKSGEIMSKAMSAASAVSGVFAERFVGAWRLVSFEYASSDGSVTYSFGRHPRGLLTYTPDGYMSMSIAA